MEGQVLDKNSGLPLKNEKIQIFQSERESPFTALRQETTDKFGKFDLKGSERNYYAQYVVQAAKESTYFPVNMHSYHRNHDDDWHNQIVFFTDRAIYRPGQTVYFKAILYRSKGKEKKIVPNNKVEIHLNDVNGEEVGELQLVSNEFGSVHGEFVLPASGLTGAFELSDDWSDWGTHSIQVEEYKRPKFKVEMDTLKGVYQLNEEILVKGNAKMFSGATVSDAKVVYRVYRQPYNPYRWWWWRPAPSEPEVEMTQGETTTNAEGNFSFSFEALPAKHKKPKENRAYIYKIVADVVDISGETHTGNASVRIGDIPLQIAMEVQEKVEAEDFKSIKIKTTNLNGAKTEAAGNLTITEILPLDRVLRDQQKETDYELVPKAEFVQKLPYISYENEHLLENRQRGQVVLNQNWNTANSDSITWNQKLAPGTYEVKATSIYKNDTIESVRIVEVFDLKKKGDSKEYFNVSAKKSSWQPGETAEITFSSDAENANVLVEVESDGKIVTKEFYALNDSKTFSFPIEEAHRGGVFVHYYFHKFNASKAGTVRLAVPYDNKKLDITTSVLRDKLEPGQEETWTLTIKDKKGDKFLAEVLAGMYDKSLDEFVENPWEFFPYGNNYPQLSIWNTNNSCLLYTSPSPRD